MSGLDLGGYAERSAYSDDGRYRWWFELRWGDGPLVCWVGLNPGTGDTDGKARPTLRRMVARSAAAPFGALRIVNLFSYRTTKPEELHAAHRRGEDVVGAGTDGHIAAAHGLAELTVAAWGGHGRLAHRGAAVTAMLPGALCLGTTSTGEPRHPLYVRSDVPLVAYRRSPG